MYRLINNKTKEKTICKLVNIDGFDYYVSSETAKPKEYYYSILTNSISISFIQNNKDLKKVLCTNNPNIDIPQVIDETEEGFNIVDDIKVRYSGEEADLWCSYKIGFGDGYNKAKEIYQFTEEDIFGLKDLLQKTSPLMFEVVTRKYIRNLKETKTIYYE